MGLVTDVSVGRPRLRDAHGVPTRQPRDTGQGRHVGGGSTVGEHLRCAGVEGGVVAAALVPCAALEEDGVRVVVHAQAHVHDQVEGEEVACTGRAPYRGKALEAKVGLVPRRTERAHEWSRLLYGRARARRSIEDPAGRIIAAPPQVALKLPPVVEARDQHARPPARRRAWACALGRAWRPLRRRLRPVRVSEAVPVGPLLLLLAARVGRVGRGGRGGGGACGEQPPARERHRALQVSPRGRVG
eukprot:scaffold18606_cov60-Phaeocystis_antarctica.AAC.9